MTTLLIAEHDKTALKEATTKALTAARQLGAPVHILVAGSDARVAAEAAAKLEGVNKVLYADAALYDYALAEPLADLIVFLAGDYDALVAPATSIGKNVMPRVAALLDVMQLSDVSKVISSDTFERPIYAGNAVQTVQSLDAKKILTIRATAFPATGEGGAASIEIIAARHDPQLSHFVSEEIVKSERPELTAAKVVISGGRSLASKENFAKYIGD